MNTFIRELDKLISDSTIHSFGTRTIYRVFFFSFIFLQIIEYLMKTYLLPELLSLHSTVKEICQRTDFVFYHCSRIQYISESVNMNDNGRPKTLS